MCLYTVCIIIYTNVYALFCLWWQSLLLNIPFWNKLLFYMIYYCFWSLKKSRPLRGFCVFSLSILGCGDLKHWILQVLESFCFFHQHIKSHFYFHIIEMGEVVNHGLNVNYYYFFLNRVLVLLIYFQKHYFLAIMLTLWF